MTNLFSFPFGGAYGGQPHSQLARDEEGNLYGTTELGTHGDYYGTVFKIAPDGTVVWSTSLDGKNGEFPEAGLLRDQSGNLYGTASLGGVFGRGTVFKISSSGRFLWSTSFDGVNGAQPAAALTAGNDGEFYGAASSGGDKNLGTVFRVSPDGRITRLYSFTGHEDGAHPVSSLFCAFDGNFYGTTGGSAPGTVIGSQYQYVGYGTIFKINREGIFTTLHAFGAVTNSQGVSLDGAYPAAGLTQGAGGFFYGTTSQGGAYDDGTVFKMRPDGSFVWSFDFANTNGSDPQCNLVRAADGNLYGTTSFGGSNELFVGFYVLSVGTVFKITPDGVLTTLYSFGSGADSFGNPLDGAFPDTGLTTDLRGTFYGTTAGGLYNPGTVFRLSTARPVLAVAEPRRHHFDESVVAVTGKTKSKLQIPITNVVYQLNGGSWNQAATTNNWTNWAANITLAQGTNKFCAYALDASGDASRTNILKLRFRP